jgi:Fe/S biogenesis protein NfuA
MSLMAEIPDPILTINDRARKRVLEIRAGEEDGDSLALWVEVVGVSGAEWAYDLYFDLPAEATADDAVQHGDDLTVVIPAESVERLRGASLEMSRDLLNPGLVIVNENKPPQPARPASPQITEPRPENLTGPVAQRVQQVLEQQINPSIASHGGQATLVAVEDHTAYLRLGGGCVGCGMATVTLSQGIEVAIREAVPEIEHVIDVTDHASGTNPYYEAAKK